MTRRWARHPRCVGLARTELRKALGEWGLESVEDSAVVVLSELLTNAVVHARTSPGREIQTCFRHEFDGVVIAVEDEYERLPMFRTPDEEGGRGLALVAGLADNWGVSDREGVGKSVWAVLTETGVGRGAR
ncbi:ATP-binding protein [Streptomyces sp. HU2014]|uniref:ATP-binding protein n=1 Tax=Streptomyces sp. HU2014 TaxID=2939414 RepID=UPI002010064A|nr:ATP-binding protein [Streptomyces sp. HU2014]UQI42989.1 ATP-binding protein [Streptomyces sp. HU2014]